jgi:AP2 domain
VAIAALSTKLSTLNRSGYRGVSWYPRYGKWLAQVHLSGKHWNLGYFDDVHDAGIAASDFRLQHEAELEGNQQRGRQLKTQANRVRVANLTAQERKELVQDNFAGTFEERSKRSRKGWETRRKKVSV